MKLSDTIYAGGRLGPAEARALFSWDLLELGAAADFRRELAVPGETVGFILDRIINYTNICEAKCLFCAYHARAGVVEPYELSLDEIIRKVGELEEIGGTQVMLQGGIHPEYTLDRYIAMISAIKKRFPGIYLHSFSPAEIHHLAVRSRRSLDDILAALRDAGLDSVPGASDLLVDRIRGRVSPHKISRNAWCEVMRALKRNGMTSTATMTYGMGETLEERVGHLETVRAIQDETGILRAFIPWSFSPARTGMEDVVPATGLEYLRMVAVARIYLDNIPFIQAGWLTEGLKLAQLALAVGANDFGGMLMEEVVVRATGIRTSTNMDQVVDIIRNAGKKPAQRDSQYRIVRQFA